MWYGIESFLEVHVDAINAVVVVHCFGPFVQDIYELQCCGYSRHGSVLFFCEDVVISHTIHYIIWSLTNFSITLQTNDVRQGNLSPL